MLPPVPRCSGWASAGGQSEPHMSQSPTAAPAQAAAASFDFAAISLSDLFQRLHYQDDMVEAEALLGRRGSTGSRRCAPRRSAASSRAAPSRSFVVLALSIAPSTGWRCASPPPRPRWPAAISPAGGDRGMITEARIAEDIKVPPRRPAPGRVRRRDRRRRCLGARGYGAEAGVNIGRRMTVSISELGVKVVRRSA